MSVSMALGGLLFLYLMISDSANLWVIAAIVLLAAFGDRLENPIS